MKSTLLTIAFVAVLITGSQVALAICNDIGGVCTGGVECENPGTDCDTGGSVTCYCVTKYSRCMCSNIPA